MIRAVLCVIILLGGFSAARAEALSASDKVAVQQVITQQLKAFAADNGPGAYELAAPVVKSVFPTVEIFMAMVKQGYQPVYRNKSYDFGDSLIDHLGRPTQRVVLTALDGKRYEALYSMERQPDGTWKIAACVLIVIPGLDA